MTVRLRPADGWPERGSPAATAAAAPTTQRRDGTPVIELTGLRLRPGRRAAARPFDLVVGRGEMVMLTGRPGSGRSALLHVLGLLDRPAAGTYLLNGVNTARLRDRDRSALRARQIGFVFQRRMLLPTRSVLDNVMLPLRYVGAKRVHRISAAMECLDRVGLAAVARLPTWQLSANELALCAIARALVNRPGLLLCDDPTAGLDTDAATGVIVLLTGLHRDGKTVLIATGDQLAAAYSSRSVRIDHPTEPLVVGAGPPADAPSPTRWLTQVRRVIARPTTLRPADAADEAMTSILARPLATTATGLSALLAVGWFVAVLGLVSTASGQVTAAFARQLPTTVRLTASVPQLPDAPFPFPADVERRLDALAGVVAAGVYWQVKLHPPVIVSPGPEIQTTRASAPGPAVIAGTPGFLAAAGVQVGRGRLFDTWDQSHAAPLCLVGSVLARSFGITGLRRQPAVYINDVSCVIAGIVTHASRRPSLLESIILPSSAAVAIFGPPDQRAGARPAVLIATTPGAAGLIARQAPYVVSPARPHRLTALAAPAPVALGREVAGTLTSLFIVTGWIGLAVGLAGIAGTALFSVAARMPEYALRRAFGARRRHIAAHVLAESVIVGLIRAGRQGPALDAGGSAADAVAGTSGRSGGRDDRRAGTRGLRGIDTAFGRAEQIPTVVATRQEPIARG